MAWPGCTPALQGGGHAVHEGVELGIAQGLLVVAQRGMVGCWRAWLRISAASVVKGHRAKAGRQS
jgi:hypothetical protein